MENTNVLHFEGEAVELTQDIAEPIHGVEKYFESAMQILLAEPPEAVKFAESVGIDIDTFIDLKFGCTSDSLIYKDDDTFIHLLFNGKIVYEEASEPPLIFNAPVIGEASEYMFVTNDVLDAVTIEQLGHPAVALLTEYSSERVIKKLNRAYTLKSKPALIFLYENKQLKKDLQVHHGYDIITPRISDYMPKKMTLNALFIEHPTRATSLIDGAINLSKNNDALADFTNRIKSQAFEPTTTGLKYLDNLLNGGIVKQSVMVIMAPPATGKTTLCQNIAEAIARQGGDVSYINYEMSTEQMLAKTISNIASTIEYTIDTQTVLQGYRWNREQRARIENAINEYRKTYLPHIKYVNMDNDLDKLKSYLKDVGDSATSQGTKAPTVVLDYLHLVSSQNRIEPAELIKQTIKTLKQYAMDYNTFCIAISAVNRRGYERLNLSSARDSSNIEYTGDYVIGLDYEEDIFRGEIERETVVKNECKQSCRRMELTVYKGRFVPAFKKSKLKYYPAINRFEEADTESNTEKKKHRI